MKLIVNINGKVEEVELSPGDNILDTMQEENVNAPFGCQGGVCGSCMCKVVKGKVDPAGSDSYLTPSELEEGYILACQSQALDEDVEITYSF